MPTTQQLIQQINRLFSEGKMNEFINYLADDVVWDMYGSSGHTTFRGKAEIENMDNGSMPEMHFTFDKVIVDGNFAVADGMSTGKTKEGKDYRAAFCDVYQFKDDKVVKITSYVVDLGK